MLPKPLPKGKNRGRKKWLAFRRDYLKFKRNFEGYYICSHCDKWCKYIEVDHIIKRSIAPERVYDPTNLRLLCHDCHRAVNKDYN